MTPADAVVNAPVTRAHREEAARAFCSNSTADSANVKFSAEWLRARELDDADELPEPFTPVSPLTITGKLDAMAQSLANLEAAVRREYEGLVDAARVLKARVDIDHVATASDCCDLFIELETLKNGK
jgi:hypothetical protein